ncbi:hypothetical protein AQ1_00023 [alpha proteobacterium Q-1]|nr:hypothetical protein AQ1_00023 [alpha proteobacterium Q-1]
MAAAFRRSCLLSVRRVAALPVTRFLYQDTAR